MTAFDRDQLDKACRKRNEIVAKGGNPPKNISPAVLAEKYGVTVGEVLNRLKELSVQCQVRK
jgi:DNA-binding Lrp family transcriptional regulator